MDRGSFCLLFSNIIIVLSVEFTYEIRQFESSSALQTLQNVLSVFFSLPLLFLVSFFGLPHRSEEKEKKRATSTMMINKYYLINKKI